MVALRCDIHRQLDSASFPADLDEGYVVQHLNGRPIPGYPNLHRPAPTLHDRVRNQFLYARFAYTILALVGPLVLSCSVAEGSPSKLGYVYQVAYPTPKEGKQFTALGHRRGPRARYVNAVNADN
ncbi:hypothetical protein PHLGIDRAFT_123124 [Phlebiopsis gigantea 11061_1 CR5-6]|uniref:Uncharacterized protein n=1 Tax=Phlebiopsis gigantea (strain 11061_1 CR5-6) TaxID=745531 RepID=A0A0C3RZ86_PHLG1|nr:hypothetical protein PHLGIDRAFT_123124 [Phlebiopsis gigantea 11061_1 CR5-6]